MHTAVIGAGTMGRGIAHVCGTAGYDVGLYDTDQEQLADAKQTIDENLREGVELGVVSSKDADAARQRIDTTAEFPDAVTDADLVIEAVPERESLKRDVLSRAAEFARDGAVLASNTSSISITALGTAVPDPGRFLGIHFSNPVHIMELIELIIGEETTEETVTVAEEFVSELGKTPIVADDVPGFATSRLGVTLAVEAMRMVETGVASPKSIDTAMELGYNHPMGPLELTDHVGLDVRLDILTYLHEELGERFRPPQILKQKVRAGNLGRKTGRGFYTWEGGEPVK